MGTMGNDWFARPASAPGLTQRELAEKAGTTQSAIARLESGRTQPAFDDVLRLVRLCWMRPRHVDWRERDDLGLEAGAAATSSSASEERMQHRRRGTESDTIERPGQAVDEMNGAAARISSRSRSSTVLARHQVDFVLIGGTGGRLLRIAVPDL